MPEFETVVIPFKTSGNYQYLDLKQLEEEPWLAQFVETFHHCFRFDVNSCRLYYMPPDDPNAAT